MCDDNALYKAKEILEFISFPGKKNPDKYLEQLAREGRIPGAIQPRGPGTKWYFRLALVLECFGIACKCRHGKK